MFIKLYQIAAKPENDKFMFRNFKTIMDVNNNKIPAEIYECVFCGELDVSDAEEVFFIFNMEHPEGYQGRSMSVSDVVEFVHTADKSVFYFCDSFGFKQVEFNKLAVSANSIQENRDLDSGRNQS